VLLSLDGMHSREKRTELVTIRLPQSTRDGLQAIADADRRPLASLVAKIVEDWYAARQTRKAKRAKD